MLKLAMPNLRHASELLNPLKVSVMCCMARFFVHARVCVFIFLCAVRSNSQAPSRGETCVAVAPTRNWAFQNMAARGVASLRSCMCLFSGE